MQRKYGPARDLLDSIGNNKEYLHIKEFGYGDLYSNEENYDFKESKKHYKMSIDYKGDFSPAYFNLAVLLFNAGMPNQAKRILNRLLSFDDKNILALEWEGKICLQEKEYGPLEDLCKTILAIDPNNVFARFCTPK